MSKIHKIKFFLLVFSFFFVSPVLASISNTDFNEWLKNYKKYALSKGISQQTINIVFDDVKFLEKVIEYDRRQPEFFEDTITYVNKRATISRAKKAKKILKSNGSLLNEIEKKFEVEKEILLALWGI